MSFVDPGAGGGKNGGGGAGTNIDPNAAGDQNFDPSASTDMGPFGFAGGGGGTDMSGGGRGPDTSAASVANTQLQAPYDIQAGGGLRSSGGGPATDQPQVYKTASAALMGGPQQVASRTTFGQEAVAGDQTTGDRTVRPGDPVSYFGHGGTPDAPISSSAWGPDPNTNLAQPQRGGVNMPVLTPYGEPNTGNVNMPIRTPYQDPNTGSRNMPVPPPPAANVPPTPGASQGAMLPPGSVPPTPGASQGAMLPPGTPQATPPATAPAAAATGGQGAPGMGGRQPQSPLEQLIGQFLQMLGIGGQSGGGMGGILSPMEHMLARALGINLPQPYPGFNPGFNSPFSQRPGPGQFPAGTVGGRPPLSQFQPPGSPGRAPGPGGAPGTTPSALPPGRRGMPSRAMSYAPQEGTPEGGGNENHPNAPEGTPSPSARQAGAGGPNTTGVPDQVLGLARRWATRGGPGAVFQFMKDQNHPRSGAWCGEFAAAVMHSQGLPVPNHPEIASNWRTWGSPAANPKPGDIAVNKISYMRPHKEVPIGGQGSHVSTVTNVAPDGTLTLTGGNQHGFRPILVHPWQFRNWDVRTMSM